MLTKTQWPAAIAGELKQTNQALVMLVQAIPEEVLNLVPPQGGWTPAQVVMHLMHSGASVLQALHETGAPADRAMDAHVAHLRKIFLDFDHKMKAPPQLEPEFKTCDKEMLLRMVQNTAEQLEEVVLSLPPDALCTHPLLGTLTRFEMVSFVVFHTRRHMHQIGQMPGCA